MIPNQHPAYRNVCNFTFTDRSICILLQQISMSMKNRVPRTNRRRLPFTMTLPRRIDNEMKLSIHVHKSKVTMFPWSFRRSLIFFQAWVCLESTSPSLVAKVSGLFQSRTICGSKSFSNRCCCSRQVSFQELISFWIASCNDFGEAASLSSFDPKILLAKFTRAGFAHFPIAAPRPKWCQLPLGSSE